MCSLECSSDLTALSDTPDPTDYSTTPVVTPNSPPDLHASSGPDSTPDLQDNKKKNAEDMNGDGAAPSHSGIIYTNLLRRGHNTFLQRTLNISHKMTVVVDDDVVDVVVV